MSETQTLDLNKVSNYLGGDVTADSFIEAINTMNKVRAEIAKTGKTAFALVAKKLFEAAPQFTAVKWTQYAPYFNDGDACEFSVHEPSFAIDEETAALVKDPDGFFDSDEEDEDGNQFRFVDAWSIASDYAWEGVEGGVPKVFQELKQHANEFHSTLNSIEDICKETFGEHNKVIIYANGNVEITDYDHD